MERPVLKDFRLVLDAARQHQRDDRQWKSVNGPAYFEANLNRAENRKNLGEAINRLEQRWPELMTRFEGCADILRHLTYAHRPESGLLYVRRTDRDVILAVLEEMLNLPVNEKVEAD